MYFPQSWRPSFYSVGYVARGGDNSFLVVDCIIIRFFISFFRILGGGGLRRLILGPDAPSRKAGRNPSMAWLSHEQGVTYSINSVSPGMENENILVAAVAFFFLS